MDNATHAIAGLLVADALVLLMTPRGAEPSRIFRARARWASAIANNLPDLDFLYRGITPGRVGYLLHHRGHTHTLGVALLLGFLSFLGLRALFRSPALTRPERLALLGLSLLGPWIHVAMDFSNNYGVHPFWPFYSGWFYGDAVFIIEPLYFVLAIPALVLASGTRAEKWLLSGVLLTAVGLAWATRFAGYGMAFGLTLAAVGSALLTRHLAPRTRTWFALAATLTLTAVFFGASGVARARVMEAAARGEGGARLELVDASLAPAPSNPLCWSAMAVGRRGDRYELLVATVSLAPGLVATADCELEPTGHTLPLALPGAESTAFVRWDGEWTAPLGELKKLERMSCDVSAYLRWARLPFWLEEPGGGLFLGDLRYDRDPGLDFAEVRGTLRPKSCPPRVPPWISPRTELLSEESRP